MAQCFWVCGRCPLSPIHAGEMAGLHANPIMLRPLLCEGRSEGLETKGSSFGTGSAVDLTGTTDTVAYVNGTCEEFRWYDHRPAREACLLLQPHGTYDVSLWFGVQSSNGQSSKQLIDEAKEEAKFGVSSNKFTISVLVRRLKCAKSPIQSKELETHAVFLKFTKEWNVTD